MALVCMLEDKLHTAMEKGDYAIGIFIDFRKAFDIVDHSILLYERYQYGVRGPAYDWFCDYLYNKTQFVSFNDVHSQKMSVSCGVPQGSILGPLLFLTYINDMAYVPNKLSTVLFADDANLFDTNNDLKALVDDVNAELEKVINKVNPGYFSLAATARKPQKLSMFLHISARVWGRRWSPHTSEQKGSMLKPRKFIN